MTPLRGGSFLGVGLGLFKGIEEAFRTADKAMPVPAAPALPINLGYRSDDIALEYESETILSVRQPVH